jgi:hypothetical protein
MSLRGQNRVLVPIVIAFVLAATTWTSGCAGFAEPLPQLSLTPNSLSVSTAVGSTSSQAVMVANTGSAAININQANVIGAGFSVAGLRLPLTLSPGQAANFSVKFVPSTASSVDGTLSLVTDLQHRPVVLQLHGKASPAGAPVSLVTLSPASASPSVNGDGPGHNNRPCGYVVDYDRDDYLHWAVYRPRHCRIRNCDRHECR